MSLPRDKWLYLCALDGVHHHGHGGSGAEPVAVVVPACVVADVVEVAEQVGHCGELLQTAARLTCRINMKSVN